MAVKIGRAEDTALSYTFSRSFTHVYQILTIYKGRSCRNVGSRLLALYERDTGRLPSRPDGNKTVGYDYGLLLYSLTETITPAG